MNFIPSPIHAKYAMSHATPKMQYFAKRLISHESRTNDWSLSELQTAFVVTRKLRPLLEELMGNTGFRALVTRSMLLAKKEVPALSNAKIDAHGDLEEFQEAQAEAGLEVANTGGIIMLAEMLGLLGSFIGELLTMQLVLETWPELPLKGYFSQEDDHEKTN